MFLSLEFWAWMALSITLYLIGDYFSVKWAHNNEQIFILYVCVSYMLCGLFWLPLLKWEVNISTIGYMWLFFAQLGAFLEGVVLFSEPFNATRVLGICLGLLATYLLV